MTRIGIILWLAAALAACDDGKKTDQDADADVVEDTVADAPADTTTDPDVPPDTAVDTTEVSADTAEEEIVAVCGNLTVEPGEDCDPPGWGAACTTPCGTVGEGVCAAGCRAAAPEDCTPPAERCNRVDEDCDALVDEGAVDGWDRAVQLTADPASLPGSVDVAAVDGGFAAIWVVDGAPDSIHLALLDEVGDTRLADTALALSGVDTVAGRPAVEWTGSDLLVAWRDAAVRGVAAVGLDGSVGSEQTTAAADPGGSVDLAWSASHAALVWVEAVSADPEVHVVFVDAGGADEGSAVRLTSAAGDAREVFVDATATAVAVTWIDSATGQDEVHLAVLDHAGAVTTTDAALTSTGGATSPQLDAVHRLLAFVDDRTGTDTAWVMALDTTWTPVGAEQEASTAPRAVLAANDGLVALGAGPALFTLGLDGTPEDAGNDLGVELIAAAAPGDITVAAAGTGTAGDLVMGLAGCAHLQSCTSWTRTVSALETRAGADTVARFVGLDAAIEGSFEARPVSYLSIQIFQDEPYGGPTGPGGHILTGQEYDECGVCVLVYEGCDAVTCDAVYLARGGKLVIDEMGGPGDTFSGRLVDAQLARIELGAADRSSTWVEDGDEICLGEYAFEETLSEIR